MFNAFAMVQVGCITLGVSLYGDLHSLRPAALGYVNHVETSPSWCNLTQTCPPPPTPPPPPPPPRCSPLGVSQVVSYYTSPHSMRVFILTVLTVEGRVSNSALSHTNTVYQITWLAHDSKIVIFTNHDVIWHGKKWTTAAWISEPRCIRGWNYCGIWGCSGRWGWSGAEV